MFKQPTIQSIVRQALREDSYTDDVTSNSLISSNLKATAVIIAKSTGVLCGTKIAKSVFKTVDPSCRVTIHRNDGQSVKPGMKILTIKGRARKLLSAERTALNFITHLSGISTLTAQYVKKTGKGRSRIYDTRKTIPGLRDLAKYAVRCGGGVNHRRDLSGMVLIKDNHRHLYHDLNSLNEAIAKAKKKTRKPIEVEVDSLNEFKLILDSKPDIIMLDNMTPLQIRKAIQIRNKKDKAIKLEASGGITLKNIEKYIQTKVDRIAIGAITHSAPSTDFNMEISS